MKTTRRRDIEDNNLEEELCSCGSSIPREFLYDARGIYLTYVCPECRDEKLKKYRRDVLFDPEYYCDEPIDEDY